MKNNKFEMVDMSSIDKETKELILSDCRDNVFEYMCDNIDNLANLFLTQYEEIYWIGSDDDIREGLLLNFKNKVFPRILTKFEAASSIKFNNNERVYFYNMFIDAISDKVYQKKFII